MDGETFQRTEKIYHYTSISSAFKIIESNKLRFGELKKMNDINESYRPIFWKEELNIKPEDIEKELAKYRQISLIKDNVRQQGFNIPAMWAHYAKRGRGVCLVFDKKKLLSGLGKNMRRGKVKYKVKYDPSLIINESSAEFFFRKNAKDIFFTKTRDWSYEQEYRIVTRVDNNNEEYLRLGESIIAVIFCFAEDVDDNKSAFNSINVEIIKKIAPGLLLLELGGFLGKISLRDEQGRDVLYQQEKYGKLACCD